MIITAASVYGALLCAGHWDKHFMHYLLIFMLILLVCYYQFHIAEEKREAQNGQERLNRTELNLDLLHAKAQPLYRRTLGLEDNCSLSSF